MSLYPMTSTQLSLDHVGGTKSYHTTLVQTQEGMGLLVKRWGKTGQFGDLKTESYATYAQAEKAFEKIINEKVRKDYRPGKTVENVAEDQSEIHKLFGRVLYAKLDAGALQHLDPTIDVSGRREPDPAQFDEDGEYLGRPEPRKLSPEEVEAARRQAAEEQKQKEQAGYASNPLFGRF